jgi:hypothetical protein
MGNCLYDKNYTREITKLKVPDVRTPLPLLSLPVLPRPEEHIRSTLMRAYRQSLTKTTSTAGPSLPQRRRQRPRRPRRYTPARARARPAARQTYSPGLTNPPSRLWRRRLHPGRSRRPRRTERRLHTRLPLLLHGLHLHPRPRHPLPFPRPRAQSRARPAYSYRRHPHQRPRHRLHLRLRPRPRPRRTWTWTSTLSS